MIKVSELYIYPVKSLSGIKIKTSKLSQFGLEYDRRWMIVDDNGKFITQREMPIMATIRTTIINKQLVLSHKDRQISIMPVSSCSKQMLITVWKDSFMASLVDKHVDTWLSNILNKKCHLVYMHESSTRQIDTDFAQPNQYVSFADAFPLLVISQASLDDLNQRLGDCININRFRPNIVVTGTTAFAEDEWIDLSINNLAYKAVKKCSRCIMPTINQQTGKQDKLKILNTLNSYRKQNNKIKFGQNLIFKNTEFSHNPIISCGDEIYLK